MWGVQTGQKRKKQRREKAGGDRTTAEELGAGYGDLQTAGILYNDTKVDVLETITGFDAFLLERGMALEAVVIGGAALNLLGVVSRRTKDCDVLSLSYLRTWFRHRGITPPQFGREGARCGTIGSTTARALSFGCCPKDGNNACSPLFVGKHWFSFVWVETTCCAPSCSRSATAASTLRIASRLGRRVGSSRL